jgi:hypothetical protein
MTNQQLKKIFEYNLLTFAQYSDEPDFIAYIYRQLFIKTCGKKPEEVN